MASRAISASSGVETSKRNSPSGLSTWRTALGGSMRSVLMVRLGIGSDSMVKQTVGAQMRPQNVFILLGNLPALDMGANDERGILIGQDSCAVGRHGPLDALIA